MPAARSCSVSHAAYAIVSSKFTRTTGCRGSRSGISRKSPLSCAGSFRRYSSLVTSYRPIHIPIAATQTNSIWAVCVTHGFPSTGSGVVATRRATSFFAGGAAFGAGAATSFFRAGASASASGGVRGASSQAASERPPAHKPPPASNSPAAIPTRNWMRRQSAALRPRRPPTRSPPSAFAKSAQLTKRFRGFLDSARRRAARAPPDSSPGGSPTPPGSGGAPVSSSHASTASAYWSLAESGSPRVRSSGARYAPVVPSRTASPWTIVMWRCCARLKSVTRTTPSGPR